SSSGLLDRSPDMRKENQMKPLLTCLAFAVAVTTPAASPRDDYHERERNDWSVEMGRFEWSEDGEKTFKVRFSDTPSSAFIGVYNSGGGMIRLEVYDPNGR